MPCRILRTLYLKANGDIPCDDDFGEQMVLGWIPRSAPFSIESIFGNAKYHQIVEAFSRGDMPWGYICERCALNRPGDTAESHLAQRSIGYFQIETTLACALECPGCSRLHQITHRPGPHKLDMTRFRNLISALRAEGYTARFIDFCGQGEPLDHSEIRLMIAELRDTFPRARIRIITNGNRIFEHKLSDCPVDILMVSVDGATAESYARYRIRGDFNTTLEFMRDAKNAATVEKLIWKYILFEHNDTPDEIRLAESLAKSVNVDELLFIRTHSEGRSARWDSVPLPLQWERSADADTPMRQRQGGASS